jgi:hypothetical protein
MIRLSVAYQLPVAPNASPSALEFVCYTGLKSRLYLALGLTLVAAAELRINAAPFEGCSSRTLGAELGLRETGFTVTVPLALDYRGRSDFFAKAPKSRLPTKRHFTFLQVTRLSRQFTDSLARDSL